jgi:heme A synthase
MMKWILAIGIAVLFFVPAVGAAVVGGAAARAYVGGPAPAYGPGPAVAAAPDPAARAMATAQGPTRTL